MLEIHSGQRLLSRDISPGGPSFLLPHHGLDIRRFDRTRRIESWIAPRQFDIRILEYANIDRKSAYVEGFERLASSSIIVKNCYDPITYASCSKRLNPFAQDSTHSFLAC